MSLNFPNTPAPGQVHNENGSSWTWDGTAWLPSASLAAVISLIGSGLPGAGWTVVGDMLVQWGTINSAVSAATTLTFPKGFKTTPVVQATANNTLDINVTAEPFSTTQARLRAFAQTGTLVAGPVPMLWLAIGEALDADKKPKTIQTVVGDSFQEFHAPLNNGSWRITGRTLECWGRTVLNTNPRTITFPKTFARSPTINANPDNSTDQGGANAFVAQLFGAGTTGFSARAQFINGATGVGDSGAPLFWRAIGEWDGVS